MLGGTTSSAPISFGLCFYAQMFDAFERPTRPGDTGLGVDVCLNKGEASDSESLVALNDRPEPFTCVSTTFWVVRGPRRSDEGQRRIRGWLGVQARSRGRHRRRPRQRDKRRTSEGGGAEFRIRFVLQQDSLLFLLTERQDASCTKRTTVIRDNTHAPSMLLEIPWLWRKSG